MSNDPFITAADEAQTETVAAPEAPKAAKKAPSKAAQGSGDQGKVSVTLKGGSGFDAPWIVLYGDTPAEVASQMDEELAALATKTAKVAKFFQAQVGPSQAGRPQPGKPEAASQAPGGETKSCSHGEMVFRSGVNASTKKTWKAYFCPTPKDTPGQCKPEFLR